MSMSMSMYIYLAVLAYLALICSDLDLHSRSRRSRTSVLLSPLRLVIPPRLDSDRLRLDPAGGFSWKLGKNEKPQRQLGVCTMMCRPFIFGFSTKQAVGQRLYIYFILFIP